MKIGLHYSPRLAGAGMNKLKRFAGDGGNNTHVPHYPIGAVATGKEDQIAHFGVPQWNGVLHRCKVGRYPGHRNIKMFKYISHEAGAIKSFTRVGRSIQVGRSFKGAGITHQLVRRGFTGFYGSDMLSLVGS